MIPTAQMRAIERAAIAGGAVTGLTLMQRAAEGAVAAVLAEWPELGGLPGAGDASTPPDYSDQDDGAAQALLLCGPGNNGGDGFAMARILHDRGWQVRVLFLEGRDGLPPDAAEMRRQWEEVGPTSPWQPDAAREIALSLAAGPPLLIVDALFGIGLSRPLGPVLGQVWSTFLEAAPALLHPRTVRLCAVDIPSGLSDEHPRGARLTGFDTPALPRLTVTFHAPKLAHRAMIAAGERLRVVDIGLGRWQEDAS